MERTTALTGFERRYNKRAVKQRDTGMNRQANMAIRLARRVRHIRVLVNSRRRLGDAHGNP